MASNELLARLLDCSKEWSTATFLLFHCQCRTPILPASEETIRRFPVCRESLKYENFFFDRTSTRHGDAIAIPPLSPRRRKERHCFPAPSGTHKREVTCTPHNQPRESPEDACNIATINSLQRQRGTCRHEPQQRQGRHPAAQGTCLRAQPREGTRHRRVLEPAGVFDTQHAARGQQRASCGSRFPGARAPGHPDGIEHPLQKHRQRNVFVLFPSPTSQPLSSHASHKPLTRTHFSRTGPAYTATKRTPHRSRGDRVEHVHSPRP